MVTIKELATNKFELLGDFEFDELFDSHNNIIEMPLPQLKTMILKLFGNIDIHYEG